MRSDDQDWPDKGLLAVNPETMSVEALQQYLEKLHTEISRVRDLIAERQRARQGAEAIFRP
jgi:uncharacterized small protein (DUF1192 family)